MIGPRRRAILAYHGVGSAAPEEDPSRLVVSPALLESHVRLLDRSGYTFRTAEELVRAGAGTPPGRGTAVLTFDDGWRDWVDTLLPLLERLGVRASFYVCPGMWGAQHELVSGPAGRLIDADGVRTLAGAGMDVGSHSMSHPDLRGLGDAELRRELVDSKLAVEELTGRPCLTFAYPFGLYDDRVERAVADAGYELAFGWLPGRWRPLTAPRLPGPPRHGGVRLWLKLLGLRRPGR